MCTYAVCLCLLHRFLTAVKKKSPKTIFPLQIVPYTQSLFRCEWYAMTNASKIQQACIIYVDFSLKSLTDMTSLIFFYIFNFNWARSFLSRQQREFLWREFCNKFSYVWCFQVNLVTFDSTLSFFAALRSFSFLLSRIFFSSSFFLLCKLIWKLLLTLRDTFNNQKSY